MFAWATLLVIVTDRRSQTYELLTIRFYRGRLSTDDGGTWRYCVACAARDWIPFGDFCTFVALVSHHHHQQHHQYRGESTAPPRRLRQRWTVGVISWSAFRRRHSGAYTHNGNLTGRTVRPAGARDGAAAPAPMPRFSKTEVVITPTLSTIW